VELEERMVAEEEDVMHILLITAVVMVQLEL
jgi:hypothetical protein